MPPRLPAPWRRRLLIAGGIVGALVAAVGAWDALATASAVTVVTVFAGAFGSGAAVTAAVAEARRTHPRADTSREH